ncbi:GntR family transcriptional regulator [Leucobacter allii]|uniref:GntR family transcriptional regulator n=1 Tax=Leucobacter allii TaxID=2932247 RepID=UPI003D2806EA
MAPGEKLPGVRELSKQYQASAATVSAALAELNALGLVRAEPGRGTFVTARERLTEPDYAWQSQALGRARVDADRASRLGGYGTPSIFRCPGGTSRRSWCPPRNCSGSVRGRRRAAALGAWPLRRECLNSVGCSQRSTVRT